ncbi:MAG TPA: GlcNAc transferase [Planctomycetaceae bacterium]|nr:GlcNAc transferase [Planctomycetaceae bacterium]
MTDIIEIPQTDQTLESSQPLAGETVTFTGTLASMVHREAHDLVERHGGRAVQSMSGMVTMLVIGEEGWPLETDGRTSQKLGDATRLIADGTGLRIVAESDWLHLIGLSEQRDEIRRSYTPAMLSQLLDVSVNLIRRWARIGLIRPVRTVGRAPFFDYREVATTQRLARLLDEGVTPDILERSLTELSRTLAGTDRSLAQLNLLVQDDRVLLRDTHGILNPRTGQRLLDFEQQSADLRLHASTEAPDEEPAPVPVDEEPDADSVVSVSFVEARMQLDDRSMDSWTADEWFNEACRLSEEASFAAAINAFRNCLTLIATESAMLSESPHRVPDVFPDPADVHFHLADALYRSGNSEGAMERYHCAIELAPDFIEAWTQLGCLQAESGRSLDAEMSFLTAIAIHDANPDALLHYSQLLDGQGRTEEALHHWKCYLQLDSRGPWADHARERIRVEQEASAEQATDLPEAT